MKHRLLKEGMMGNIASGSGLTPLHIEIALHYFNCQDSDAVAFAGSDSDAVAQACHELAVAGLLENAADGKHWKATEGMSLYAAALCAIPLPEPVGKLPGTSPEAGGRSIGDETVRTRNVKISDVMKDYVAGSPLTKL